MRTECLKLFWRPFSPSPSCPWRSSALPASWWRSTETSWCSGSFGSSWPGLGWCTASRRCKPRWQNSKKAFKDVHLKAKWVLFRFKRWSVLTKLPNHENLRLRNLILDPSMPFPMANKYESLWRSISCQGPKVGLNMGPLSLTVEFRISAGMTS